MQVMYKLSEYFDEILKSSSANTKLEVDTLHKIFKRNRVTEVLDIACGTGRHATELAKRGYKVTGIDYSKSQISVAKNKAKKNNLKITFLIKDANKFKLSKKFDAAICMWSTIAEEPMEFRKVIKNAFMALKPEGTFIIDNKNWAVVKKSSAVRHHKFTIGKKVLYKKMWDRYTDNYRIRQAEFKVDNKKYDELCLTQMLSPEDLKNEMRKTGFKKFQIYYDYSKLKTSNHERYLIVGKK